jgi:hypothetical protein
LAFGEETFKRALKAKLVEALREELTSGDGNVKALIAQLLLSTVLRDSTGAELSSFIRNLNNLDVALSVLSRLIKWGRDVTPAWVHGSEVTAPAAGTALVSWTVPAGKTGFIYGFFISVGEGNDFKINWTSGGVAYSRRIVFPGKGTLHFVDMIALNEGLPADGGTSVTITNVNVGSAGIVYQAALLVVAV